MEREELKRIIESLLFVSDKSLETATLSRVLDGAEKKEILSILAELKKDYQEKSFSFHVVEVAEGFQMCTKPEYSPWIKKLYQSRLSNKLSKQSLETLAIIAYKQPVIKAEIDFIRGVNSDGVLNTLLDRNLIRIVGRQDAGLGRPFLYGTTKEFLQQFGLKDLNDLPSLPELKELLAEENNRPASDLQETKQVEVIP